MVSERSEANQRDESMYPVDNIAYQRFGLDHNPPLLILHGWGSSATLMAGLATTLGEHFNVFCIDLPGHGKSPAPRKSMGIPEHADLVAEFIRRHMQEPVIVVGHSNGGRISLYMAASKVYASLFSQLVLISPSGIKPKRGLIYYIKVSTAKLLKAPFVKLPEPLRSAGLRWVRGTFLWQLLGSSDYKAATGVMREVFTETVSFFVDDVVQDIGQRTLLIWGSDDTAISRHQINRLMEYVPEIQLVELEGAGHYGFLDQPGETVKSIYDFLAVEA
ncbi:MAG: alpha/beta hydrolase [Rhodothermales bacterium]|nr:alpha/beta hydrolase [Rhodothermales bacterium]